MNHRASCNHCGFLLQTDSARHCPRCARPIATRIRRGPNTHDASAADRDQPAWASDEWWDSPHPFVHFLTVGRLTGVIFAVYLVFLVYALIPSHQRPPSVTAQANARTIAKTVAQAQVDGRLGEDFDEDDLRELLPPGLSADTQAQAVVQRTMWSRDAAKLRTLATPALVYAALAAFVQFCRRRRSWLLFTFIGCVLLPAVAMGFRESLVADRLWPMNRDYLSDFEFFPTARRTVPPERVRNTIIAYSKRDYGGYRFCVMMSGRIKRLSHWRYPNFVTPAGTPFSPDAKPARYKRAP